MKTYVLMATDEFIADRLSREFAEFSNVEVYKGVFQNLGGVDCLVSPANSFGIMDGGMDLAITDYFGKELQDRVQEKIKEEYFSEQPVGTSFILETDNENFPYLAHTPTMRVPQSIDDTDNVYNAMRATLIETEKHTDIKTVAIPAFGHGSGNIHASDVAYQMGKAFLQVVAQPDEIDWNYASSIDYAINKYTK